jgi:hypothetical protein
MATGVPDTATGWSKGFASQPEEVLDVKAGSERQISTAYQRGDV